MKVFVIKEHVSNYPNPITFEPGDMLILGEMDTEYTGWIRVETQDGNKGWAPDQYIDFQPGDPTGLANSSYNAFELDTSLNERLTVIKELNGWYLVTNEADKVGWVPVQSVERLPISG